MAKLSKKQKAQAETVDREKLYAADEALKIVKRNATSKFDETIEIAMNLAVDPRHADQMVRSVVSLLRARARTFASPCSPRMRKLTKLGKPAPIWLAPKI